MMNDTNSIIKPMGSAIIIQSRNEISILKFSCIKPTKTILGAVPIRLDIPPIDEAYAIPRNKAISKFFVFLVVNPGSASLMLTQIARQIGRSIKVVEVFSTHMLIKNEMHIKAPTILPADVFTFDTTDKASLLCRPDL